MQKQKNLENFQPEMRYARLLFIVAISSLALLPLLWLSTQPAVTRMIPLLRSESGSVIQALQKNTAQPGIQAAALSPKDIQEYDAQLVSQSQKSLTLQGGEKVQIWVDFKNIGSAQWVREGTSGFVAINVTNPIGRTSPFQAADWDKDYNRYPYRPNRMFQESTAPGDTARFYITLQAPTTPGSYTESFGLVSEWKEWISGGQFQIPITVTKRIAPSLDAVRRGDTLRVGILNTTEKVEISASGPFTIKDSSGTLVASYNKDQIVTATYANGIYSLEGPAGADPRGWHYSTTAYLTFKPAANKFIEFVNYSARPTWNSSYNDNYFRGSLEYRHSDATNKTWIINVLPLEAYIRGVAEISNSTPKEMQRAMTIAERTYAEYHRRAYSKHRLDFFHVDNLYDQVYRGVGMELRNTSVVQSVQDTTGEIVTYQGNLAITPYFSRSDGRTRSFVEVWGGAPKPWLVSVDVPWSKGQTLLGHGVGMDAFAGVNMAQEGWAYADILKYFYTGTALTTIY